MSDSLRSKVIRLAYQQPSLRPHLLPILKVASRGKTLKELIPQSDVREALRRDILAEMRSDIQWIHGRDAEYRARPAVLVSRVRKNLEKGVSSGSFSQFWGTVGKKFIESVVDTAGDVLKPATEGRVFRNWSYREDLTFRMRVELAVFGPPATEEDEQEWDVDEEQAETMTAPQTNDLRNAMRVYSGKLQISGSPNYDADAELRWSYRMIVEDTIDLEPLLKSFSKDELLSMVSESVKDEPHLRYHL